MRDCHVQRRRLAGRLHELPPELVLGPIAARIDTTILARQAPSRTALTEAMDSTRYLKLLATLYAWQSHPPFDRRLRRHELLKRARKAARKADRDEVLAGGIDTLGAGPGSTTSKRATMDQNLGASTPGAGVARATATQTALTTLVAQFAGDWKTSNQPPDLSTHLPVEPALRRTTLIELIKVDLHERWRRSDNAPRLADYRDQYPELGTAPLPPDLIYEEISARSCRHDVDLTEYEHDYPAVIPAGMFGQVAAGLYPSAHTVRLIQLQLGSEAAGRLTHLGYVVIAISFPVAIAGLLYWCRNVFLVPDGLRRGKHFDEATLARPRTDTLACGDRIAAVAFIGWILAMGLFALKLLSLGPIPGGLLANLIVSSLVAAAVAVVYTYFPATFFVLRWYYLGLVAAGHISPDDAPRLHRLIRRSRVYLGVAASVPLIGVSLGLIFLTPNQQHTVIGSIVALCIGGLIVFAVALRTFYALQSDLAALERIVNPRFRSRT